MDRINITKLIAAFNAKSIYLAKDQNYKHLVEHGQQPEIMLITCCDSRADPALLFQADFGDIFVLRNVANIVPAFDESNIGCATGSALEFAVTELAVKDIVIIGHSDCVGIKGLCAHTGKPPQNSIEAWLDLAKDSLEYDLAAYPAEITQLNDQQCLRTLALSWQNLASYPQVGHAIDRNALKVHAWFYDINKLAIKCYNHTENIYETL